MENRLPLEIISKNIKQWTALLWYLKENQMKMEHAKYTLALKQIILIFSSET
jgi:hypothetical protein